MTKVVNYSRNTTLERSVKALLGWGEGWEMAALIDFTWLQTLPSVLPWYTHDICSVRVKDF